MNNEPEAYYYFDTKLAILRVELAARAASDPRKGKCRGCGCPVRDGYERCGKPECSPFYGRD